MSHPTGIVLVLLGVCFLFLGLQEANLASGATLPRESNMWLMVTGAICTILGVYFLLARPLN